MYSNDNTVVVFFNGVKQNIEEPPHPPSPRSGSGDLSSHVATPQGLNFLACKIVV